MKTQNSILMILFALLLFSFSSCEKDKNENKIDYTGTWVGLITRGETYAYDPDSTQLVDYPAKMLITQDGDSIFGSAKFFLEDYLFTGTVNKSNVKALFTKQTDNSYTINLTGALNESQNAIDGTWFDNNSTTQLSWSFSVSKQD